MILASAKCFECYTVTAVCVVRLLSCDEKLHVSAWLQVTFEQNVPQAARHDQFSSALVNVSLSDTSAKNNDHRLRQCSGTVCAVWHVESFAKTVAKLFPASDEWCFGSDPQQSRDGKQDGCAKRTAVSSADEMLFSLPCFVLISVGDALSRFSPFSPENLQYGVTNFKYVTC